MRALSKPVLKPRAFVMTSADIRPVEACEAAALFVSVPKPTQYNVWAGIFVHRFIEITQKEGDAAAAAWLRTKTGVAGKRAAKILDGVDVASLPRGEPEIELIVDARELSVRQGAYRDASHESDVYMRLDVSGVEPGGGPFLVDWKTSLAEVDVEHAEQFQLNAFALWLVHSRPAWGVVAHAVVLHVELRGHPRWHTHHFSARELEKFGRRLKRAHAKMRMARLEVWKDKRAPEFEPGPHCRTCRARHACTVAEEVETVVSDVRAAFGGAKEARR